MSGDSTNDWKTKYLTVLEEMEASEEKERANQKLMQRAIVRVCLAADGLDERLDHQLNALRKGLRDGHSIESLEPVIDRLEDSVMELDDRRREQNQETQQIIEEQLANYQKLDLPRTQTNELKAFTKTLPELIAGSGLKPALIKQLSSVYFSLNQHLLQQSNNVDEPKPGLISKLFGGSNRPPEPDTQNTDTTPHPGNAEPDVIQKDVICGDPYLGERLSRTLCNLLEQIDVPEEFSERKEKLIDSVKTEFQPEQLPDFLDETTQLVASIKIMAQKELEQFLVTLHHRLNDIQDFLINARQGEKEAQENQEKLDHDVRKELREMRSNVEKSDDVVHIKQDIEFMMDRIVAAVDAFHEQENHRRQAVHTRFESLTERMATMESEALELKINLETQRKEAMRDALTELPNRAAYDAHIQSEFSRWRRHSRPLSITIIDIDHFKKINDTLGHLRGDKVLKLVAREISQRLRSEDFVARYGGEEFVIIMPETDLQSALVATEKVRAAIESCPFSFNQQPIPITASFGVTSFENGDEIETCFERADKALYRAKELGRNRVEQG
ncbi:GGDEF domain-containing protein [Ketobacter sp. MCCC 1A13808]|uniref:GGDEF domain-containing protein n=1 Tax=Ketobacter sp. MCCC 1A13808 TaxID=2602738 RepID=UPI000F2D6201|nr:GGDEF domain-containing protein [Ketobacter sp. MCCC 1A13808]MVF11998.1 GGDEF domain-containing protein [Ketobacter sp. MCCC 1A13808]RLP52728.1 MAG: GGDEF domain-containing protein [Ketobacter sp.]